MNLQQTLENMDEIQKDIKALQDVLTYAELLKDSNRMTEGCFETLLPIFHGAIDGSQRAFNKFKEELKDRGEL